MPNLKIIKKHHKHVNNPFPSTPKSLPIIQGNLSYNPHALPCNHVYSIGTHFQALWSSDSGGYFSICHRTNPKRSVWSTVPGQAFVSAAVVETQVEESRGSFAVKDKKVHLVCNRQSIDDIKVINNQYFPSGISELNIKEEESSPAKSPVLLITGWILSMKSKNRKFQKNDILAQPYCSATYSVVFYEKNNHQIGFKVKLGKPNYEYHHSSPKPKGLYQRLGRFRRRKLSLWWFSKRPNGFEVVRSSRGDDKEEHWFAKTVEFNRVCMTYSSEENEKFFGFGEQFSHMDFKGKRVPIFVQEQGIGRGDQPITLAINLVSYRAAGDWSTTYAPSPFYMTSKMRSLYLKGYNYTIFDLTQHDRVQIQVKCCTVIDKRTNLCYSDSSYSDKWVKVRVKV